MKLWLCVGALAFARSLSADDPLAEFQDVQWETYRDEVRGFTFRHPYHWSSQSNSRGQRVFYDFNSVYDSRVTIYARSRDPKEDLAGVAREAASQGWEGSIVSEKSIELNGLPAYEVEFHWVLPAGERLTAVVRVVAVEREEEWLVFHGLDGRATDGFDKGAANAIYSVSFQLAACAVERHAVPIKAQGDRWALGGGETRRARRADGFHGASGDRACNDF